MEFSDPRPVDEGYAVSAALGPLKNIEGGQDRFGVFRGALQCLRGTPLSEGDDGGMKAAKQGILPGAPEQACQGGCREDGNGDVKPIDHVGTSNVQGRVQF